MPSAVGLPYSTLARTLCGDPESRSSMTLDMTRLIQLQTQAVSQKRLCRSRSVGPAPMKASSRTGNPASLHAWVSWVLPDP